VFAVRELEDGDLEVMDGNHRLEALEQLGWSEIVVESFGPISKAEAILIARRRNHAWFEDDNVRLSRAIKDDVLPEISLDEMLEFMPDTRESLQGLIDLADNFTFEDDDYDQNENEADPRDWGVKTKFAMPKEAFDIFMQAYKLVEDRLKIDGLKLHKDKEIATGQVIEALAAEYLSGGTGFGRLYSLEDEDREVN